MTPALQPTGLGARLANWQAEEEGAASPFDLATIAHTQPAALEISDAVQRAHADQVERLNRNTTGSLTVRGEVRYSLTAGFQFVPEEATDGDRIAELLGGRDWHLGAKVTLSI